jgi:hypothetical protein
MVGMRLSIRVGLYCLASLVSALLFCFGCSIHEDNRLGQSQDAITFFFSGMAYLSICGFICLGLGFIAVLIKER